MRSPLAPFSGGTPHGRRLVATFKGVRSNPLVPGAPGRPARAPSAKARCGAAQPRQALLRPAGRPGRLACMGCTLGALCENPTRCASGGRCRVTGPLTTLSSLSGPLVARMLSFCSSCTISPQKRRNVRGSRTCAARRGGGGGGSRQFDPLCSGCQGVGPTLRCLGPGSHLGPARSKHQVAGRQPSTEQEFERGEPGPAQRPATTTVPAPDACSRPAPL